MTRYAHVANYLFTHPWAIMPEVLRSMTEIIQLRAAGGSLTSEEITARLAAAREGQGPRNARSGDTIGVIPIYGVIMPKANLMSDMSGATTVDSLRSSFRALLADDEVSRIVFDIDSPGGSVEGVPELGEEIRAARGIKPMTAVSNYMAASAAYWLGSQADEFVASPSAMVGSIGVYATHIDESGANEQAGIKPTYISAGKHKVDGNPSEPLSDAARTQWQSMVDGTYEKFLRAVGAGRGVPIKAVRDGYGEGFALDADQALGEGMIDRIATFEEAVTGKAPRMRARRQAAETAGTDSADELALPPELSAKLGQLMEHLGDVRDAKVYEFERERRRRKTA